MTGATRTVLAALFVAAAVLFFRDGFSRFMAAEGPGTAVLQQELSQLRLPVEMAPVGAITKVQRGGPVGATRNFASPTPPHDIHAFFTREMPKDGWIYEGQRVSARGEITLKFCKNEKSLKITTTPQPSMTAIYVTLLWTNIERDPAYCPRNRSG